MNILLFIPKLHVNYPYKEVLTKSNDIHQLLQQIKDSESDGGDKEK